jgi:hypothetical protein
MRLGQDSVADAPVTIGDTASNITTGVNAELVWLENLSRQARGLAPLPPSASAPKVNIGLSPDVQTLIIGGIIAAVLIAALVAKKR